jgi:hypothetical protein
MSFRDKNIFKQNKPDLTMNKKGQELSTNAIIMIVIGVIVLVVLVLGFTIGWNKLLPFVSSNNVQGIVTGCSTACSTNNNYDYCTLPRILKADDLPVENGVKLKEKAGTCNFFSSNADYVKYGIDACSTISC